MPSDTVNNRHQGHITSPVQDVIQDLRQQVDSLKSQVGSMLDEAEAKDRQVSSIKQQLDIRNRRIRDLSKELQVQSLSILCLVCTMIICLAYLSSEPAARHLKSREQQYRIGSAVQFSDQ